MAKKTSENVDIKESIKEVEVVPRTVTERYKTAKCKVLSYNKKTKELDIDFKGYGVRLNNIDNIRSDIVSVKYRGEIGKSNFLCSL